MKIAEVANHLKTYIATVRVNGAAHKTSIKADSSNAARSLLLRLYGQGNVSGPLLGVLNWQRRVLGKSWMLASSKSKPWQIKPDALLSRNGNCKQGREWLGHKSGCGRHQNKRIERPVTGRCHHLFTPKPFAASLS